MADTTCRLRLEIVNKNNINSIFQTSVLFYQSETRRTAEYGKKPLGRNCLLHGDNVGV
uniref:Uncharacterized protein n=1 Tax=Strigamia maritima TaxID=126957 RepID=T1IZV7_STRMM